MKKDDLMLLAQKAGLLEANDYWILDGGYEKELREFAKLCILLAAEDHASFLEGLVKQEWDEDGFKQSEEIIDQFMCAELLRNWHGITRELDG